MKAGFQRFLSILFLLLSFLFFSVDLSWGGSPIKKVFPGWTSYTSSSCIKDLVLDQGVLWAAAGGVIKYDLQKGTRVKYLKEHGIASNNVLKIVVHGDTLWAATANGITCHHLKENTWKSFYLADGLPDDAVTAAAVDTANNRIWFGSWEGYLFNFDTVEKKWNFFKSKICIPDTVISSLAVDPGSGLLLVGTWGKGLYTYKPGSQILVKQNFTPCQSCDFISAILVEDRTLWIGTANNIWVNKKFLRGGPGGAVFTKRVPPGRRGQNIFITNIKASPQGDKIFITTAGSGLLIYFKKTGQWKTIDTAQGIPTGLLSACADDGENIFLGSDNRGIIRLNLKTGKIDRFDSAGLANEIAHNKVSDVTPDPANNRLWIGTEGNGAAVLDLVSEKWTILNSANRVLLSDVVNCIAVDGSNDSAWIGTDNGMVRYVVKTGSCRQYGFEEGLDSVMVYAAGFDHLDRPWAAFFIGSPAVFDARTQRWRTDENAPAVTCHALAIDKKSQFLRMATARGIVDYNMKTRKSTGYWTGTEFRSLWFDAEKKEIWAGSWGEGLFHLEMETGKREKIKRFENLSVLDIKKDEGTNTIWFATNEGAYYFDRERQTFGHLDVTDGLGLNFVLAIGITGDSIWFGTWDGGLSRMQKDFCLASRGGSFCKNRPP